MAPAHVLVLVLRRRRPNMLCYLKDVPGHVSEPIFDACEAASCIHTDAIPYSLLALLAVPVPLLSCPLHSPSILIPRHALQSNHSIHPCTASHRYKLLQHRNNRRYQPTPNRSLELGQASHLRARLGGNRL